jgi:hypothetical protein
MKKRREYTGGAADRRRRGLRAVLVPLTPEQHRAVTRAAALADPPSPVTRWAAACLEEAARRACAAAGVAEKPPGKS